MPRMLGDAALVRLSLKKYIGPEYTLVDAEDFERVSKSKWSGQGGKSRYAFATSFAYVPERLKALHRFIMWAQPGQMVDHINGDTLDNRRQNLRFVTSEQNAWNSRRQTFPGKSSRFKGVSWDRHHGRWLAGITFKGERHDIGRYDVEEDAARAYDKAALICFDEYARTNEMMQLFEMEDPFVPNLANTCVPDGEIDDIALAGHRGFYFGKMFDGWGRVGKHRWDGMQHYLKTEYDFEFPEPTEIIRIRASRHCKRKIEVINYPKV